VLDCGAPVPLVPPLVPLCACSASPAASASRQRAIALRVHASRGQFMSRGQFITCASQFITCASQFITCASQFITCASPELRVCTPSAPQRATS